MKICLMRFFFVCLRKDAKKAWKMFICSYVVQHKKFVHLRELEREPYVGAGEIFSFFRRSLDHLADSKNAKTYLNDLLRWMLLGKREKMMIDWMIEVKMMSSQSDELFWRAESLHNCFNLKGGKDKSNKHFWDLIRSDEQKN